MVSIHFFRGLGFFAIGLWMLSCSPKSDAGASVQENTSPTIKSFEVQIAKVTRKPFTSHVISNGKVLSAQELSLAFSGSGLIEKITVRNGASVSAGQLLASLRNDEQRLSIADAENQLQESEVEVNDLLLTQGGQRGDTNSVSPDVYRYIKLRSGYNKALLALRKAQLEFSKTFLYAPIDGVVANLTLSPNSQTPSDKPFCTLFSRDEIFARCQVLETELASVQTDQTARIIPIGRKDRIYSATVTGINPIVDPHGLVEVTLRIDRPDSQLLSGMNVRVIIERTSQTQTVVPRPAVLKRGERNVIFTYVDGLAKWNYVDLGQENEREIVVVNGIRVGDYVIFSGNQNLAHDAPVKIISDENKLAKD
jgi:membrane fusion protein, multidrug efflux system